MGKTTNFDPEKAAEQRKAEMKDITVSFEHLMNFPEDIKAEIINTGKIVNNDMEFMLEVLRYGFENKG